MLESFGWTERPFSKSNLRFCPAKRSQHALRSPYGPVPLLVLLLANYKKKIDILSHSIYLHAGKFQVGKRKKPGLTFFRLKRFLLKLEKRPAKIY